MGMSIILARRSVRGITERSGETSEGGRTDTSPLSVLVRSRPAADYVDGRGGLDPCCLFYRQQLKGEIGLVYVDSHRNRGRVTGGKVGRRAPEEKEREGFWRRMR